MQSKCSKCGEFFVERVGMGPMDSNLAIRVRNKIGNICPKCRENLCKTKRGRFNIFVYNFKVALYCARFLLFILIIFAVFTICLALFVL